MATNQSRMTNFLRDRPSRGRNPSPIDPSGNTQLARIESPATAGRSISPSKRQRPMEDVDDARFQDRTHTQALDDDDITQDTANLIQESSLAKYIHDELQDFGNQFKEMLELLNSEHQKRFTKLDKDLAALSSKVTQQNEILDSLSDSVARAQTDLEQSSGLYDEAIAQSAENNKELKGLHRLVNGAFDKAETAATNALSISKSVDEVKENLKKLEAAATKMAKAQTQNPPPPPKENQPKKTPTQTPKKTPEQEKPRDWARLAEELKSSGASADWQLVHKKKKTTQQQAKPTQETLLRPKYPRSAQKIVLKLAQPLDPDTTTDPTKMAPFLSRANKALVAWQKKAIKDKTIKQDHPQLILVRAYAQQHDTLVFETSPDTRGVDFEPAFPSIRAEFKDDLNITNILSEARWTHFLLHGVPLDYSVVEVEADIKMFYPALKLAMTPRWLVADEAKRMERSAKSRMGSEMPKLHSTMVITIVGQYTIDTIGTKTLSICNRICRLATFYALGANVLCGKCCKYGHETAACKEDSFTCGVCGEDHQTSKHDCDKVNCKGGGRCIHGPYKCVNCNSATHTSIDPNCPERAKRTPSYRRQDLLPPRQPPPPPPGVPDGMDTSS